MSLLANLTTSASVPWRLTFEFSGGRRPSAGTKGWASARPSQKDLTESGSDVTTADIQASDGSPSEGDEAHLLRTRIVLDYPIDFATPQYLARRTRAHVH